MTRNISIEVDALTNFESVLKQDLKQIRTIFTKPLARAAGTIQATASTKDAAVPYTGFDCLSDPDPVNEGVAEKLRKQVQRFKRLISPT